MAKDARGPKVYEYGEIFKQNCLLNDNSLLWPQEKIWTLDTIEECIYNFYENPIYGNERFWNKLKKQFEEASVKALKLLADTFFVYVLPSMSLKKETKYNNILEIAKWADADVPPIDDPMWDVLDEGICHTGQRYHMKYGQLWTIFFFAKAVKQSSNREELLNDHKKTENILDEILNSFGSQDQFPDMRHALLNILYPDYYEPIISTSDKEAIVRTFENKIRGEISSDESLDEKILKIRQSFEESEDYKDKVFHFYNPEIKSLWKPPKEKTGSKTSGDSKDDFIEQDLTLNNIFQKLRRSKQLILYGPPGTGKTYYALKVAREITSLDNFEKYYDELTEEERKKLMLDQPWEDSEIFIRMCTFHPSYGYEDFIEGFKPALDNPEGGNVNFKLHNGIFKQMCLNAEKNPEKSYVLLIDEINRGDIPRIFGEIITLLETDKRKRHGQEANASTILPLSQTQLTVPDNLYVIGTMNTADRSIALLDVALRRRFAFFELMPAPEELENKDIGGINLSKWLAELNKRINEELERNLQIGHAYFMKNGDPISKKEDFLAVIREQIFPLLQDICYDSPAKLKNILGSELIDSKTGMLHPKFLNLESDLELFEALVSSFDGTKSFSDEG